MAASSAIGTAAMTLKYKNQGRAIVLKACYYTKVLYQNTLMGLNPAVIHLFMYENLSFPAVVLLT
jgi:hypothetical protein